MARGHGWYNINQNNKDLCYLLKCHYYSGGFFSILSLLKRNVILLIVEWSVLFTSFRSNLLIALLKYFVSLLTFYQLYLSVTERAVLKSPTISVVLHLLAILSVFSLKWWCQVPMSKCYIFILKGFFYLYVVTLFTSNIFCFKFYFCLILIYICDLFLVSICLPYVFLPLCFRHFCVLALNESLHFAFDVFNFI